MKVLLVSPRDPARPKIQYLKYLVGGENTYTCQLLANPPKGVSYIHLDQAVQNHQVFLLPFQKIYSNLMKLRLLPTDVGIQALAVKDHFDLIHCHVYSLMLLGYTPPVVLSDSSSNILFLKDYLGWSSPRIRLTNKLRKYLDQRYQILDPNLNLATAKKLVVWSKFAKKIHVDLGTDPRKISVIPPGIEKISAKPVKHKNFNILFVGVWFERKGGPLVLQAYKILAKKYPQVKLIMIGQLSKGLKLPSGINHHHWLPREKLHQQFFSQADVLVLVPPKAEGYGLTVVEAASFGIPAVVSRVYALPEIVQDGRTGFVIEPGNIDQLVGVLERMILNRSLRIKIGQNARKRFEKKFWIKRTNEKLLKVYQEAVG